MSIKNIKQPAGRIQMDEINTLLAQRMRND
jgi:hypothetical protein